MMRVALLLYPGARSFDIAVAREAFAPHRTSAPPLDLDLRTCASGRADIELSDGVRSRAERTLTWLAAADLVLVPGLEDPVRLPGRPELAALRTAHRRGARVASLCAGAFVLAAAGLLDGRRATTHWALAPRLAAEHPDVRVEPEALYVADDGVWTSAGVAAGIDLCLALLRERFGAEVAAGIARSLVAAPHRAGGQGQFIPRAVADAGRQPGLVAAAQAAFELDPARSWSVAELAAHAHVSARTFARRFAAESGTTPHRWLVGARLIEARRLLETTALPIEQVAARVGFGSSATLRARFAIELGTSPTRYRETFTSDH